MTAEEIRSLLDNGNYLSLTEKSKQQLTDILGADFAKMKGYSQNNPHHCYDLLEHTVKTVEALKLDGLTAGEADELKIAALYHDIGKPVVAFEKNGRTVFYYHARESKKSPKWN